jgi:copper chaperone
VAGTTILAGEQNAGDQAMLRFRIEGMTCQGCVRAVAQAVGAAAPGQPVEIDLATGEVAVGGAADAAAVADAIGRAGFAVAERRES